MGQNKLFNHVQDFTFYSTIIYPYKLVVVQLIHFVSELITDFQTIAKVEWSTSYIYNFCTFTRLSTNIKSGGSFVF